MPFGAATARTVAIKERKHEKHEECEEGPAQHADNELKGVEKPVKANRIGT